MAAIGKPPPPTIQPPSTSATSTSAASSVGATSATGSASATAAVAVVPDSIASEAMKLAQAGNTRGALQLLAQHVPTIKLALSRGFGEAHSTAEQNAGLDLFRDTLRSPPSSIA